MKKILFTCLLAIVTLAGNSCKKDSDDNKDDDKAGPNTEIPAGDTLPDELIAPNNEFWTKGVISSINYHDPNSSEYRNAGGLFIFFKFYKNGTYKFMLYWNQSSATTRNQTWTEVEGNITMGETVLSDGNTYKTFKLNPVKGTDRIITDTRNTTHALTKNELATRGNLSATFAFSTYVQNGKQFLDILNMANNAYDTLHEEY